MNVLFKFIFLTSFLSLFLSNANAGEWSIQRISNNNYGEYGISIYENKLVWQGYPQSNSSDIFYYDGSETHKLTDNISWNMFPKISSKGIVWSGNMPSMSGTGNPIFYDFSKSTVFSSSSVTQLGTDIYQNIIAWSDATTKQIMIYDGTLIRPINNAFGSRPRISSGGILYTNNDYLYLYDWNNIIDLGKTTSSNDQNNQPTQQINGNKVTWFKNMGQYEKNEVMLYDCTKRETTQITSGNIHYGQPDQPVVRGDYIAWYDHGRGGVQPIKLFNGERIITIAESDWASALSFGNGFLAWSMKKNGQPDLFVYDLKSNQITQLTNDSCEESGIVAYGNLIAYLSHCGGNSDVYLAIDSIRGDVNNDSEVDIKDAILSLQIISSVPYVSYINLRADINSDGKIGLAEAIYALQCAARLRNNHSPVLTAIGNKSVDESYNLTFSLSAADEDNDLLTFSASTLPSGATFNANTKTFSWNPTYSQSGTYPVTFTVSDNYGGSASETVTITVNDKISVIGASEYFPLNVGDWQEYISTGIVSRTTVSGTKSIGGYTAMIRSSTNGDKQYYSSDQSGIKYYGQYSASSGREIIFNPPLLEMPNNSLIGTINVSTSTYSSVYSGYTYNVNITSTTKILGIEDVPTANRILKDCVKVSQQFDQYVVETGESVPGATAYYWLYKGVGSVKTDTQIISGSYVNGVEQTY